MKFRLTEEERMLQRLFADFFEREFQPPTARLSERVLGGWSAEQGFQEEIWEELTMLGIMQLTLPVEAGGIDLGETGAALVSEQMGRVAYQSPYFDTVTAAGLLLHAAEDSPLRQSLEQIAMGECRISRMDRHASTVTFQKDGDEWIAEGECRFVPFAAEADLLLGLQGRRLFLVPRAAAGVTCERHDEIGRGELCAVRFDRVRFGGEWSVELTDSAVAQELAKARGRQAAYLIGLSQGALDLTIRRTKERQQFGRPLASFQSVSFRLAALTVRVEAARLFVYYVASRADSREEADLLSSQLFAMASELALDVTTEAIQLHGSYGLCEEAEPQRYYRRALADTSLWGGAAKHRAEAARRMFR